MDDRAWVATRKGLIELSRRASGWRIARTSFLGEPVSAVLPPDRDGRMLAALNLGHFGTKLHASEDGGATWREVAAPAYPAQPDPPAAGDVAWTLVMVWTLERSLSGAPEVYAGTLPGGLFRSSDLGASWTLDEALWRAPERLRWFGGGYDVPGIHSLCVDPRDPDVVRLAVSSGGVWVTRDAGATWDLVGHGLRYAENMGFPPEMAGNLSTQDVHRLVQCPSSPERMWIQHHCGVFRSDDAGVHWHEVRDVPPSVFGFAVAVSPREPDVAYFVPAVKDEFRVPVDGKLVVTRTRDGGRTFDVLSRGLPSEPAYDLVYRHGMAIDQGGERLAIGSTTGGVWVSEDRGEGWRPLAERLPPVHAMAFA